MVVFPSREIFRLRRFIICSSVVEMDTLGEMPMRSFDRREGGLLGEIGGM